MRTFASQDASCIRLMLSSSCCVLLAFFATFAGVSKSGINERLVLLVTPSPKVLRSLGRVERIPGVISEVLVADCGVDSDIASEDLKYTK